jgi:hypothetical protein
MHELAELPAALTFAGLPLSAYTTRRRFSITAHSWRLPYPRFASSLSTRSGFSNCALAAAPLLLLLLLLLLGELSAAAASLSVASSSSS